MAGAGTGLERIDDELFAVLAGNYFVGGGNNCGSGAGIEQSEVTVDFGSGTFDDGHCPHKCRVWSQSTHGEVVYGTLCLCAIQGTRWYLDLTQ